jgi:hypothetical protein
MKHGDAGQMQVQQTFQFVVTGICNRTYNRKTLAFPGTSLEHLFYFR